MPALPVPVFTIGLLIASNVFRTVAWYGNRTFKSAPPDRGDPGQPGAWFIFAPWAQA